MKLAPTIIPCRLYAILARDAPVGVIFRRGPAKRVQVIHWNTETDVFTPGQWFHGRIFEKRGDLSPNGELMIYYVSKHIGLKSHHKDYTDNWTAISKPPYLTALALWPCGCWGGGGGLFSSNTNVWVNHCGPATNPHPDHRPRGLKITTSDALPQALWEASHLYRRLARDGWQQTQGWREGDSIPRHDVHNPDIHRKPNPHGQQTLVMSTTYVEYKYRYAYSLQNNAGEDTPLTKVEWADWDQRGRLVYARDGKLFATTAGVYQMEAERELADFNDNTPYTLVAPDWAKEWS